MSWVLAGRISYIFKLRYDLGTSCSVECNDEKTEKNTVSKEGKKLFY